MISILTVSTLFPNPTQPAHGSFVAARLKHLVASGHVTAEVIAPVPWKPSWISHPLLGDSNRIPRLRHEGGLSIHHPRYLVIPKVGMSLAPMSLFLSLKRTIARILADGGSIDLIDAHYFYPDGVAAVWAGRHFNIPVCVTARGSDLTLLPDYPIPCKMIVRAAAEADGLITVCQALKDRLVELGPAPSRVTVLRNGVDLKRFCPSNRAAARAALQLRRRTLVSVGLLVERKGHHHVIESLKHLPETDLIIVGGGPDRSSLERHADRAGVGDRVRFLGVLDQAALAQVYNAADALVLASSREGWANVLLESMACGTPVIASPVWGTPEVVASPEAGVLMKTLSPAGVIEAVGRLFSHYPAHSETRSYAEKFSWDATTEGQITEFRRILASRQSNKAA